jgi:hypothetical protein
MAMSNFSKSSAAMSFCAQEALLITFVSKVNKMDNVYGPDVDKTELINTYLSSRMNANPTPTLY